MGLYLTHVVRPSVPTTFQNRPQLGWPSGSLMTPVLFKSRIFQSSLNVSSSSPTFPGIYFFFHIVKYDCKWTNVDGFCSLSATSEIKKQGMKGVINDPLGKFHSPFVLVIHEADNSQGQVWSLFLHMFSVRPHVSTSLPAGTVVWPSGSLMTPVLYSFLLKLRSDGQTTFYENEKNIFCDCGSAV